MEGEEKDGETTSARGAEWEVVSLTASTYAAAPGPEGLAPDDRKNDREFDRTEQESQESSGAMFMSGHFVFPPNEHENLPIEPEYSEIHSEPEVQDVSHVEEGGGGPNETHEEIAQYKSDDDPQEIQFFDNGSKLSIHGMDPEEVICEEQSMYITTESSAFHAEIDQTESVPHTTNSGITESGDPPNQNLDSSPKYTKPNDEDEFDGSGLPCEAWWKRHAACFYHNAKEANTFWSVFVAAALMGLVILGKRWQQEKWHLQQLKWKLNLNDERLSRIIRPIGRFKDILIGGHQRSSSIRGGASTNR